MQIAIKKPRNMLLNVSFLLSQFLFGAFRNNIKFQLLLQRERIFIPYVRRDKTLLGKKKTTKQNHIERNVLVKDRELDVGGVNFFPVQKSRSLFFKDIKCIC